MARTRLIQAIHDAVVEEMTRDEKVIVYGEDVELSIVGDLRGVHEQFGRDRIRNTAIRDPNPCFILEPNGRGGEIGEVPDGEYLVPFGKAAVRREGDAVTVVAIGRMLKPSLAAAEALEAEGVSVEVIDPRTLVPFDT